MLALLNLGPQEMIVILVVGLLIFGRRLPEVGRSIGKTLLEFRKGLDSFKNEIGTNEDLRESRRSLDELRHDMSRSANAYWADDPRPSPEESLPHFPEDESVREPDDEVQVDPGAPVEEDEVAAAPETLAANEVDPETESAVEGVREEKDEEAPRRREDETF